MFQGILLFILLGLSACSQQSELAQWSAPPPATQTQQQQQEEAQQSRPPFSIEDYQVSCPSDQDCPDHLGMIIARENQQVWRCSGFLIDEQTIMTAKHCLPPKLQKLQASCQGEVFFKLPQTKNYPEETLECLEVQGLETMPWRISDYAVLKLKSSSPRSLNLRFNFEGKYHAQNISIWKIDSLDQQKAIASRTTCQLNGRSLLSLYFTHPRSSIIQYSGCQTKAGNSGAPVYNSQNEIIGIHSSSTKETAPISSYLANFTPQGRVQEFASATHLGCLCRDQQERFRICTQYPSCLSDYDNQSLIKNRLLVLDQAIKPIRQQQSYPLLESHKQTLANDAFVWDYHLSFKEERSEQGEIKDFALTLALKPLCLKREKQITLLEYPQMPLCRLSFRLSSHLEVTQLGQAEAQNCEQVHLILEPAHAEYAEYRARYYTDDHAQAESSNRPVDEVFELPFCP